MRELTLRVKIIVIGISLLFFPLLLFGLIIFYRTSASLDEIARIQNIQIADSMSSMIDISLTKELRIIQGLSTDQVIIDGLLTEDKIETRKKLIELYTKIGNDYESIAVFDQNGVIFANATDVNSEGISISDRNYFQSAKLGNNTISSIVQSKATGKPVFILCSPIITIQGTFVGGTIGVANADYLTRYINSLKIGRTGYAFLVDKDDLLIAHPVEKKELYTKVTGIEGVENIPNNISDFNKKTIEYRYKNKDKIVGFSTVSLSGWSVGVTQEKKETLAIAYSNALYIIFLVFIFLVQGVLFVLYVSKRISIPVQSRLMRLNQAFEQATESIFIIDLENNLQFYNRAAVKLMGEEPKVGSSFYLKEMEQKELAVIFADVKKGQTWRGQIRGKGNNNIQELSISPVKEKSGNLNSYLIIGKDITSELQLQQQLIQSQKIEAIGTLASGIAHDFNNILSAIFGYTDLAIESIDSPKIVETFLHEISKASIRARDLVAHILTFSRNDKEEYKPLILKYLIKDTLKLVRASLPSTIIIQEDLKTTATVFGDASQVHQLVMNLCTNAGYAMRKKGGLLKIVLEEENGINLKTKFPEAIEQSYLRLEIIDTGTGINPEIHEEIFNPFFTTKPIGVGTGLGLSMVHGIVKRLKGYISFTSESGKGTAFTVYLPVVEIEVETVEYVKQNSCPRGNESILLIDDESAILQSVKLQLERLGYRVTEFNNSLKALNNFKANQEKYDLIFTDYTMPYLTGLNIANEIHKIRKEIPVIISSGNMEISETIEEVHNISFLSKPFSLYDLAIIIRKLLDNE